MKIHFYLYSLWFIWGGGLICFFFSGLLMFFYLTVYFFFIIVSLFFIIRGAGVVSFFRKNKKDKISFVQNESGTKSITIIGEGGKIMGDLTLDGDVEIHGEIKGNINAEGFKVYVMEKGVIEGDVMAEYISINGRINGMSCAKNVEILKDGKLNGMCCAETFSIIMGGRFIGQSKFSKSDKLTQKIIIDSKDNMKVNE